MNQTPLDVLQRYWGYHDFRPVQEDIINCFLNGSNIVALLPTGGGKSVCYQVPAIIREGLTIIISPLIALMNDQVDGLLSRGVKAACIHSGMHKNEIARVVDAALFGNLKMLYLAPERVQSNRFLPALARMPVSQVVVDEAHCISMWGYDFRPAYLKIESIKSLHPDAPIMALTATATPEVLDDIVDKLGLETPKIFQGDFLRPNLKFGVIQPADKRAECLNLLKRSKGSTIVYVRNRRLTQELAHMLRKRGLNAECYHAGLEPQIRSAREKAFYSGEIEHIVATNAFGMGIDKSDVRMVIHYDMPTNLESYYQEAGRAGRDGKKAYAIILFQDSDRITLERNFDIEFPSMEEVRSVYEALGNYLKIATGAGEHTTFPFDISDFADRYHLVLFEVFYVLKLLEKEGWIMISEGAKLQSKFQFIVDKNVLYQFQLRNAENLDDLVRTMLRMYQGILTDAVVIHESRLASRLDIPVNALINMLESLHHNHIGRYFPARDDQLITWLRPRVFARNLSVDQVALKSRKDRRRQGLETLYEYLELTKCRQAFMLGYFGQSKLQDCGVCDRCVENVGRIPNLESILTTQMAQGHNDIKLLVRMNQSVPRQQILDTLQQMLDEERVLKKGKELILNPRFYG